MVRSSLLMFVCLAALHAESEVSVDIGPSLPGDVRTALVEVTNPDTQPWTIERLSVSCNCAQVASDAREVKPGAKISVQLGFQARLQTGPEQLRITIGYVVAGERKERSLLATTNIVDYVRAGSRLVLSEESALDVELIPANEWQPGWDRVEIAGSAPWCKAALIEEKGKYRLRSQISDANYGAYTGQIRLRFTKNGTPLKREQVIPIKGMKSGALKMSPGTLMLGTVDLGEQSVFELAITAFQAGDRAVQVRSQDDSGVRAEIRELAGQQVLRVTVGPVAKLGKETGTVFVKDSRGAELRVPFVVLFTDAVGK